MEKELLVIQLEMYRILAHIEGMKAANDERASQGLALAYGEDAFDKRAEEFKFLQDNLLKA